MRLIPRKQLFVDRKIQGMLLYRIAIYWCFAVLTVCAIVLCVNAITYDGPNDSFLDLMAFQEFFIKYGVVVAASALLVPIIMFDVLVISNRFAGPLFRLRRSMRALAAGEHVEPIRFRDKDLLPELADEFNAVLERVHHLQYQLDEARRKSGDLADYESALQE